MLIQVDTHFSSMEHAGRDLPGSYSEIFRVPLSYQTKKTKASLGVFFTM